MKAREYLEQVKRIDISIRNKQYEKEKQLLLAQGTSVNSDGDRVQSSGKLHKMEDAVVKAVEFDEKIRALEQKKDEIIATIESLDTESYDILHQKYIQDKTLWDISEVYRCSLSTIKNKHGEALRKLQIILDEREKDERR